MALNFIIGLSGSGKTETVLGEIIKKQEQGCKNLILIAPEQFTLESEKSLIRKSGRGGIISVQVLSFGRLAHNIFDEAGRDNRAVLNDTGKGMALRKAVLDNADRLLYYKNSIDKQGFSEQLSAIISELYSYSVTPEMLEGARRGVDGEVTDAKLHDIGLIFAAYRDFLSDEYSSAEETLDILYARLEASHKIRDAEIWIDGFYSFTPQEYKVIGRLMKLARNVTVSLTLDKESFTAFQMYDGAPFYEARLAADKLRGLAADYGVDVKPPEFLSRGARFKANGLLSLEAEYFSYPLGRAGDSGGIKVFSAANIYEECTEIAARIRTMVRKTGIRYRDVAALAGDLEVYGDILASVFYEHDIPFFVDAKEGIASRPIVRLIKSVIEIFVRDFSYESVFGFLKTGLTPISREETDLIENYVLAYGIKGERQYARRWEKGGVSHEFGDALPFINDTRERLMELLGGFGKKYKRSLKHDVKEITSDVFELLKQMQAAERLEEYAGQNERMGNMEEALKSRRTWKLVIEVFEKLIEMLGNYSLTLEEYSKILWAGLCESRLGIIPPTVDTVLIGDIERTRLPAVEALFVAGANDGSLPKAEAAGGIFTDIEREALAANGIELAAGGRRRALEEQYKIYCSITQPSSFLCISYARGALDGKGLKASPVIDRIKRLFPDIKEEEAGLDMFFSPAAVFHSVGGVLRKRLEGGGIPENWAGCMAELRSRRDWRERLEFIIRAAEPVDKNARLDKSLLRRLYKNALFSSVSRLEKYAACPYSYFAEYTLGIRERRLFEIAAPDIGMLFHSVLESLASTLKQNGESWFGISRARAEMLAEDAVDKNAPNIGGEILFSTAAYQYMVKRLKRVSRRAVWTIARHIQAGRFEPYGFEIGFGRDGSLPPVVIELSKDERLVLTGKIDRVDILRADGRAYVKIVDYKSGKKAFSLQDVYYGLQLQLMLYLDAFIKCAGVSENLLPGGVFYFRIKDPMAKSAEDMTADELERVLFKELKLSGLALNDSEVIRGLDLCFEEDSAGKSSDIVPISFDRGGGLKKIGSSAADINDYNSILSYAGKKAADIGRKILDGSIEPSPYEYSGQTPCTYCSYASLCGNDGEGVRRLKKLTPDEVMELIKKQ